MWNNVSNYFLFFYQMYLIFFFLFSYDIEYTGQLEFTDINITGIFPTDDTLTMPGNLNSKIMPLESKDFSYTEGEPFKQNEYDFLTKIKPFGSDRDNS